MLPDGGRLEALYYFTMVVRHGGFAAAGRALGLPKSRLSRQLAALEEHLGVRLLQRSTRRLHLSDVGREMLGHCEAMLAEAESALETAAAALAEPRGRLRVACPVAVAENLLQPLLPRFLARHPKLRLELMVANRRVDVLAEGFDAALRVRTRPSGEDGLVMRSFAQLREKLVASPDYLAGHGCPDHPQQLPAHATLSFHGEAEVHTWELSGPDGSHCRVEHQPRLLCHDFPLLLAAARAGLGIALLPESVVRTSLARGELLEVLPQWSLPQGIFHVVFPHRRGLLPAVRAFIDFLVEEMPAVVGKEA